MRRLGWFVVACFMALALAPAAARGGQRRQAAVEENEDLATMNIEQLRAYQSYFYSIGGRDPLTMRNPSNLELGINQLGSTDGGGRAPTLEEQEEALKLWLDTITESIAQQKFDSAIKMASEALTKMETDWPPIKAEHIHLIKMSDDIRNYHRLATRLKNQQDIAAEFRSLRLKIDGITWSPLDAKAVVNGRSLSAGEVMLAIRRQGDLRVEMIEETGVVFQFKGLRFRVPVEVFSQLSPEPQD